MKIALISDIHGNHHALEAVLRDIERQKPDKLIVLGDLVFKGPLPDACVRTVRALGTVVLRGNIDEMIGTDAIQPGFAKSPEHEAALRREMEWTRARLTDSELDYMAKLPLAHVEPLSPGMALRCVHATPQNVLDIVLPTADEAQLSRMFEGSDARIVAYGHIHLPYVRFTQGRTLVGTGSVGLPFDGDPRASYALIESDGTDCDVRIRRVRYDLDAAVRAFDGTGHPFEQSVIAALKTGTRPA